ncbi:TrmH family RNA methyltransferase [Poriferisphaera sp. WC338]|uniref:TrmH family RNA methyltransferase n=1 Tax=Poriferisphaera sp. WC338 TaxID=3425129 RepID=UPI003D818E95
MATPHYRYKNLTSDANPRIKTLLKYRDKPRARRKDNLIIAEGSREVTRALAANLIPYELYLSPDLLIKNSAAQDAANRFIEHLNQYNLATPTYHLPANLFNKIALVNNPQGILALFHTPNYQLDNLRPLIQNNPQQIRILIASQIEKPGNLGALIRTAASAGYTAVLASTTPDYPVDIYHPNCIRNSTAAVFSLPTIAAPEQDIQSFLTENNIRILAAAPPCSSSVPSTFIPEPMHNDEPTAIPTTQPSESNPTDSTRGVSSPHTHASYPSPFALVIGSEDRGLPNSWLDLADTPPNTRIHIPNHSTIVDSLNASAAAAVLIYESIRTSPPCP